MLTDQHKAQRMSSRRAILDSLGEDGDLFQIFTGDKTWISYTIEVSKRESMQ